MACLSVDGLRSIIGQFGPADYLLSFDYASAKRNHFNKAAFGQNYSKFSFCEEYFW